MAAPDWSDDAIATLKRMWSDGASASDIARVLPAFTRSAILGKVSRLKLERRRIAPLRTEPVTPSSAAPSTAPPRADSKFNPPVNRVVAIRSRPGAERPPEPGRAASPGPAEPNVGKGVALLDLTNSTCRWPYGDPLEDEFFFCGQTNGVDHKHGRPYCEFHRLKSIDRAATLRGIERGALYAAGVKKPKSTPATESQYG